MSKEFIKLTECRQTGYGMDYLNCIVHSSEIADITEEGNTGYSIIQLNTGKYITVKENVNDIWNSLYKWIISLGGLDDWSTVKIIQSNNNFTNYCNSMYWYL